MPVDHVLMSRTNLNRQNVSRNLRGKRHLSTRPHRRVLRHEKGSATSHAAKHSEQTAAATQLRMCVQPDVAAHPGKLARLGDDSFIRFKTYFEHGHCRAYNLTLHVHSLQFRVHQSKLQILLKCPALRVAAS